MIDRHDKKPDHDHIFYAMMWTWLLTMVVIFFCGIIAWQMESLSVRDWFYIILGF